MKLSLFIKKKKSSMLLFDQSLVKLKQVVSPKSISGLISLLDTNVLVRYGSQFCTHHVIDCLFVQQYVEKLEILIVFFFCCLFVCLLLLLFFCFVFLLLFFFFFLVLVFVFFFFFLFFFLFFFFVFLFFCFFFFFFFGGGGLTKHYNYINMFLKISLKYLGKKFCFNNIPW